MKFREFLVNMTPIQADYIRTLRVREGYTWRAVARQCHEHFNIGDTQWDRLPSNQLVGMELCEVAANIFGKPYMTGEWN